jgi:hypothetical protein
MRLPCPASQIVPKEANFPSIPANLEFLLRVVHVAGGVFRASKTANPPMDGGSARSRKEDISMMYLLVVVVLVLLRNTRKTGTSRPREFLTLFGGTNVPFALLRRRPIKLRCETEL